MFQRDRHPTLLALAVALALAAGCATKSEVVQQAPGLDADLQAGQVVALAGVAVAAPLGRFDPADAADAEAAVYGALLARNPELVIWHPATVRAEVGAAELDTALGDYARFGRLTPAALAGLRERLPGVRFLAVARVEADEVETHTAAQDQLDPEARTVGQPEHQSAWAVTMTTERTVKISLLLYDLPTGRTAWFGRGQARASERYEYDRQPLDVTAAAVADSLPILSRRGESLRLPDLVTLVGAAAEDLAGKLPGAGAKAGS